MVAHMNASSLRFESYRSAQCRELFDALAELRMTVFREYPYLYAGEIDYEREYLEKYARSPGALIVVARALGEIVGATTALPLADADLDFQAPFSAKEVGESFYFGESLLLPAFRGHGAGAEFFARREAHAREFGSFRWTVFCAVERDDAQAPASYRDPQNLWLRQGYQRLPSHVATFTWKDVGKDAADRKTMVFWRKDLQTPSP
jgi:GNAT superfamily N-acetyltransferase